MWPIVDFEEKTIDGFRFVLRQVGKEDEGDNQNVVIKEIIMVYAAFEDLEFDQKQVACSVEYDTDFGMHTILFSKVEHLKFVNRGIDWIAVFYSNYQEGDEFGDGCNYSIPEDVLTEFYRNTWKDIKMCAFYDCDIFDLENTTVTFEKIKEMLHVITTK